MSTMYNPSHPGEVLKELYLVDPLNLTVTEASQGLCITRKTLSMFVNGHAGVSVEIALKLAKAFDTTPERWLNMQKSYNIWESKKEVDLSRVKVFSWPHKNA